MNVREMGTDRLAGVSARLLAGASVLTTVGLAVNTWLGWQQIGQSYGADGTPTVGEVPFTTKVSIAVFESSFRPAGLQLLVAAALMAAAVVALHRHPSRPLLGSLRWEVLGAGLVGLVVVGVLLLAHVYVLTAPAAEEGDATWFGPQPVDQVAFANFATLVAALLVLVLAVLWWLRLGTAAVDDVDAEDPADEDVEDSEEGEEHGFAPDQDSPEAARGVHPDAGRSSEPVKDYSRDWSPEDFRPPR